MKMVLYPVFVIAAIAGVAYLVGLFMSGEHVARRSIIIDAPIEKVWNAVTDIENQAAWRGDLKEVKIIEKSEKGLVWIEYPKKGRPITFREKAKKPYSRYEIEILPGGSFSGYWIGEFSEVDNGVKLEFTEVGKIHNLIFRVPAYFFFDLEKTIKEYQENLKNHLETNT